MKKSIVNYLDDYLFISYLAIECNEQVRTFLSICKMINFPVSMEKTCWATTMLGFLGLLLNTVDQTVSIPADKLQKAKLMLETLIAKKKVTILQLQKLTGFLNFLCRAVVPGRAFTRRFYAHFNSSMQPHHHIRVTQEMRQDMTIGKQFLKDSSSYCQPFIDFSLSVTADDIDMYSDASGTIGYGAYCQNSWLYGTWSENFLRQNKPSIEYLELYALTAGVLSWIHRFSKRRIYLFTDNQSVKHMVNSNSSSCKNCMYLIRLIVLESLRRNVRVFAKYVASKENILSDALSRGDLPRFWTHAPHSMEQLPTELPQQLQPIDVIWIK